MASRLPTDAAFHALVSGEARGPAAALARAGLWWAKWPYATAVRARNFAYDKQLKHAVRVPVPVVSVGNLTVGGTGKTPCVEWVANTYAAEGTAAAILSRGYGTRSGPNDEALVLEENCPAAPHYQNPDRVAAALTAVTESEPDVLILDDGFQHRRLARDFDLVLIDLSRPIERDHLLPRGTLREPISSLHRAHFVLLTRCDGLDADPAKQARLKWLEARTGLPMARTTHAPLELLNTTQALPVEALAGRKVFAFCGVGNPQSFRDSLARLGAEVTDFWALPDHHPYPRGTVEQLVRRAAKLPAGSLALTTQKDFVKLRTDELSGVPLYSLRVGLAFESGGAELRARLLGLTTASPQPAEA